MIKTRYIISLLMVFLISCSSDDALQNTNSPLLGLWETEACKEITDNDGMSLNQWAKGVYQFQINGDIRLTLMPYSDSNCSIIDTSISTSSSPTLATFEDLGEETLQEGIIGNRIVINFPTPDNIISTEAFYTINNNTLCFSRSYIFEPTSFSISPSVIPGIDFTKCLASNN